MNTDNDTLGQILLQALANSRTLTDEAELDGLLLLENVKPRYEAWIRLA